MKSFSTDLFDLIQSLSKGERSFFTKSSLKRYGNTSAAYVKLFIAIAASREYDEAALMKKLHYKDKGAFSVLKNYCYSEILDSLIEYHKTSNRIIESNRNLQELNVLENKGLIGQYLKKWKKAYKSAVLFEEYPYIFTLKEQLQSLKLNYVIKTDEAELESLVAEDAALFSAYSELQQVKNIFLSIQLASKQSQIRSRQELSAVQRLATHPALQLKPDKRSFRFRYYYRMCRGSINYLSHEYDAAFAILNDNKKDLLDNAFIAAASPSMYLDFLQLYYPVCFLCKQHDAFFSFIEHPLREQFSNAEQKATIFAVHSSSLLRYSSSTAQYDKAQQYALGIDKTLPGYAEKIPLDLRRNLSGSLAITFFALEQYDEAYSYCKEAMNLQHHNPQKDVRQFLYLFCILIAYELQTPVLLENEIKNAYHFFYRTKNLKPFERGMISFLKKIMQQLDKSTRRLLFTELQVLLDKFRKDPVSQQVFRYFNFDAWVASKIEGIRYRDFMTRRVREQQQKV
jgi:hypothetical protein